MKGGKFCGPWHRPTPRGHGTSLKPNTHTKAGKVSLLPCPFHHQRLHAHRSPASDLRLSLPMAPALPRPGVQWPDESITRHCKADGVQPKGLHNINTKSAIFSRQWVRIMAFLYATPATQNNSLTTIAAIPGIPQNRKCCFIYNKLLGMIKQSMPTQWLGALCLAPNEPAFPERWFLIKANIVLCFN